MPTANKPVKIVGFIGNIIFGAGDSSPFTMDTVSILLAYGIAVQL